MKTKAAAAPVLAVVLLLSVSLVGCAGTKTETVSAATIAALPPGETFEIDLTRQGTIYKFDDPGTDFGRVTLRTAEGVKTFGDLLRESKTSLQGGLVLGTLDDMRDNLPTSTGGTTNFDCGVFCKCDGTADCVDMILQGKCSDEIWCSSVTPGRCFCVAKA
jgi:hypothetical protein